MSGYARTIEFPALTPSRPKSAEMIGNEWIIKNFPFFPHSDT